LDACIGPVYPDECDCSKLSIDNWLKRAKCDTNIEQINTDLSRFKEIDFNVVMKKMNKFYNKKTQDMSICQYVIKNNSVSISKLF